MTNRLDLLLQTQGWLTPNHDGFNFYNIAPTALNLLGVATNKPLLAPAIQSQLGGSTEVVLCILFDAFGMARVEENRDEIPSLARLLSRGKMFELTAQFPSTTAAHVSTFASLSPVSTHKIVEWQYYHEGVDAVIRPFLLNTVEEDKSDALLTRGFTIEQVLGTFELSRVLKDNGIVSAVVQPKAVSQSAYSRATGVHSTRIGYTKLDEAFESLQQLVSTRQSKLFLYLYVDAHDATAHMYGPRSEEARAVIQKFCDKLEQFLDTTNGVKALLFADHGQVDVSVGEILYVNKLLPDLPKYLRTTKEGKLIRFGGSARDLFLYSKAGMVDELQARLDTALHGKAAVFQTKELRTLWGTDIAAGFLDRIGDLVIFPFGGNQVYWYEPPRFECTFRGHHGGLSAEELRIPLIFF